MKRLGYFAYLVLGACALAFVAMRIAFIATRDAMPDAVANVALPVLFGVACAALLLGVVATVATWRERGFLGLLVVAPGLVCAAFVPDFHPAFDAALLVATGAGALFVIGVARRGLARSAPP